MFHDEGQVLGDFSDVMDVRCPQCSQRARVAWLVTHEDEEYAARSTNGKYALLFRPRKLSCLHCGHTRRWEGGVVSYGGPHDWYFRLPLWLQTPCCGQTLWALNREHLDFLERYTSARLRTKLQEPGPGKTRNHSLASKLPQWMKSAKNREAILKGIAHLKGLLDEKGV